MVLVLVVVVVVVVVMVVVLEEEVKSAGVRVTGRERDPHAQWCTCGGPS